MKNFNAFRQEINRLLNIPRPILTQINMLNRTAEEDLADKIAALIDSICNTKDLPAELLEIINKYYSDYINEDIPAAAASTSDLPKTSEEKTEAKVGSEIKDQKPQEKLEVPEDDPIHSNDEDEELARALAISMQEENEIRPPIPAYLDRLVEPEIARLESEQLSAIALTDVDMEEQIQVMSVIQSDMEQKQIERARIEQARTKAEQQQRYEEIMTQGQRMHEEAIRKNREILDEAEAARLEALEREQQKELDTQVALLISMEDGQQQSEEFDEALAISLAAEEADGLGQSTILKP